MKLIYDKTTKTTFASGSKYELSNLLELIKTKNICSWQVIHTEPSNKSLHQVEAYSPGGMETISHVKYRELTKNKRSYDFIYDSINERFYTKVGEPSLPSGDFYRGTAIIRYLAKSRIPENSFDIADGISHRGTSRGALIRQAIGRLNKNFLSLIINIPSQGYILNPQINWLVLIEQV